MSVGNIYQTDAWAAFQRSLGHEVVQASGDGWRYLAVVMGGHSWRYLYCQYGPEADTPEAFDAALASLETAAREKRCWFVRGGPETEAMIAPGETLAESLRRRGLRRPVGKGARTYSQLVDLSQEESVILQDMKSTNRNLHRNIHKKGVTFTNSTDPGEIEILITFLDDLSRARRFHRDSDDYLRHAARTLMPLGAAHLYVARLKDKPIGAALVYDSDDTRTYAHAAMDFDHRNLHAGEPIVVRMMLDAKQKGLSYFDLCGVAPENPGPEDEGTEGYTAFKKSFGGRTLSHSGVWDLPLARLPYAAFPTLRTARHKLIAGQRAMIRMLNNASSRVSASFSERK